MSNSTQNKFRDFVENPDVKIMQKAADSSQKKMDEMVKDVKLDTNWESKFDDYFPDDELDNSITVQRDVLKGVIQGFLADARREVITGETSDGYHTFNELYEFRKLFNALLFNEWAKQGLYDVHKSTRHFDGKECFGGGWFIVMAKTPEGQISNHYEMKDWDLFKIPTKDKANKWDGHTAQDVLKTLSVLATLKEETL